MLPIVALVASFGLLGALATASPASAVEFAPAATLDVQTACINDTYVIDITMGNLQGLATAQFVVSANTGNTALTGITYDVDAGTVLAKQLTGDEGVDLILQITSSDAIVPIDYSLNVTVDCVADTTIPATTVVGSSGGDLPTTGGSGWPTAGIASVLLLAGVALTRSTRRA
jgi:hypothetical protein